MEFSKKKGSVTMTKQESSKWVSLKVGCLPYVEWKQPWAVYIPLINLGRKWTVKRWWWSGLNRLLLILLFYLRLSTALYIYNFSVPAVLFKFSWLGHKMSRFFIFKIWSPYHRYWFHKKWKEIILVIFSQYTTAFVFLTLLW